MPSTRKRTMHPDKPAASGGESLVLVSISLVVAAIVVGLHVHMGLPMGMAALVGMSLFIGLVGFQAWRRGEAERIALNDQLQRLEVEASLNQPAAPAIIPAPPSRSMAPQPGAARQSAAVPPLPMQRSTAELAERPFQAAPVADLSGDFNGSQSPRFEAYEGAPTAAPGESFSDYWQTVESALPVEAAHRLAPALAEVEPRYEPAPAVAPSAVREDDVEMLQRRIKDMLFQVTAAEQAKELATMPAQHPLPAETAAGVAASLEALHAAAHAMHKPSSAVFAPAASAISDTLTATPPEPAADPFDAQRLAVREAIAAGRVDVFLEPILSLGNHVAQHYEVSIALRGVNSEPMGDGEGDVFAGRGLLPLFDYVRIERSAIVAERLASRGKSGAVFSRASGEALIEPDFTRSMQLDFVARPATARQLILTFKQSDIRAFRASEQRAVSALSALGFRFAISALTDLDMNFAAMANAGFGFVKVEAAMLMHGLPHPGGQIPPSDVCRFLADQGFGLIVEGIDSEETLARLFGFGVLMGQGTLFGGRRPVKADVVGKPGQAAA